MNENILTILEEISKQNITQIQIDSLCKFIKENGFRWKSKLNNFWKNGENSNVQDVENLQRLRNLIPNEVFKLSNIDIKKPNQNEIYNQLTKFVNVISFDNKISFIQVLNKVEALLPINENTLNKILLIKKSSTKKYLKELVKNKLTNEVELHTLEIQDFLKLIKIQYYQNEYKNMNEDFNFYNSKIVDEDIVWNSEDKIEVKKTNFNIVNRIIRNNLKKDIEEVFEIENSGLQNNKKIILRNLKNKHDALNNLIDKFYILIKEDLKRNENHLDFKKVDKEEMKLFNEDEDIYDYYYRENKIMNEKLKKIRINQTKIIEFIGKDISFNKDLNWFFYGIKDILNKSKIDKKTLYSKKSKKSLIR